jgi:ferredoxin-type protein NapH
MKRRWRIDRWTLARRTVALAFAALLFLGSREGFIWFRGTTPATTIFDLIPFADPLAALEVTLATRELHSTLLLGALTPLLVALLLGPVFCSWVCPLGLLLDLNQSLKTRLFRRWRRHPWFSLALRREVRFGLLGLFLGFAAVGRFPLFQILSPINLIASALAFGASIALLIVLLIVAAEWFAPRVWCRSLCPLGALYSLLGHRAPLRIHVHIEERTKRRCRQCTFSCPMGIRVMEEHVVPEHPIPTNPDCTRCGACVDSCPETVLDLGWGGGRAGGCGGKSAS